MTYINLSKSQSSSLTPGLQDLGSQPDVTAVISGSIAASSDKTVTIPIPFSTNKVISLIRLNITGLGINSRWFPVIGFLTILAADSSYDISIQVQSSSVGRQMVVDIHNSTAGTITPPAMTFTIHAHLYNYPW